MIQCKDCEFFGRAPDGSPRLACDPFATIKEPECLSKWQLVQLLEMNEAHRATTEMHRRFAPIQEKLFRHVEREIDETDDADRWKFGSSDEDNDGDEDDPFRV